MAKKKLIVKGEIPKTDSTGIISVLGNSKTLNEDIKTLFKTYKAIGVTNDNVTRNSVNKILTEIIADEIDNEKRVNVTSLVAYANTDENDKAWINKLAEHVLPICEENGLLKRFSKG